MSIMGATRKVLMATGVITRPKATFKDKLSKRIMYLGCDPEIFFEKQGSIVGAERILPEQGVRSERGSVIIDGVQGELNPSPDTCRQSLAFSIQSCFKALDAQLKKHEGVSVNESQTVEVGDEEFAQLSERSRKLGCDPSKSLYKSKGKLEQIDPLKYRTRSAGGHIHLGAYDGDAGMVAKAFNSKPKNVVRMLDILLGNTCVLLDRNPGNIERRKVYGRAGEYRLPGRNRLEYRTLSNFWLKHYSLYSFVFSLARFAVSVVAMSTDENNYEGKILECVDLKDIERAINTNNRVLALRNFKRLEGVLKEITQERTGAIGYTSPFEGELLDAFHFFHKKGINHWFKEDMMEHWLNIARDGVPESFNGWENFALRVVIPEMKADQAKTKKTI